jgi:hypothetical protein
MSDYPDDIYTEPSGVNPHTLKNLGPLTNMAGVWEGVRGLDVNPKPDGPERQVFADQDCRSDAEPAREGLR